MHPSSSPCTAQQPCAAGHSGRTSRRVDCRESCNWIRIGSSRRRFARTQARNGRNPGPKKRTHTWTPGKAAALSGDELGAFYLERRDTFTSLRPGGERASESSREGRCRTPHEVSRRRLRVGRCRAPTSEGSKQRARGWLVRRRARPAGLAAGDPGVIDQGGRHIAGERAGRQAPSGECVAMENSTRGFPLDNASPGLCHRPRLLLLCTTTTIHNPLARRRRCVCWPLDVDGGGERSRA